MMERISSRLGRTIIAPKTANQRHGRGDTGKGAQGEGRQAKDPATKDALRRAKLSVGLRSTRGEKERENVRSEKGDL